MSRYSLQPAFTGLGHAVFLLVLLHGLSLSTAHAQNLSPGHTNETGSTLIEPPRPVTGFELTHHSGEATTDRDLQGRWDLLYFGYTFCPDVCPVALSTLTQVVKALAERGWQKDDWSVWLISVDPDRDTPARLAEYVNHFNPEFNGSTGSRKAIDHLAGQMQVRYRIEPHDEDDLYYVVAHTSTFALIDPDGSLVAVLDDTAPVDELAEQIDALRDAYSELATNETSPSTRE